MKRHASPKRLTWYLLLSLLLLTLALALVACGGEPTTPAVTDTDAATGEGSILPPESEGGALLTLPGEAATTPEPEDSQGGDTAETQPAASTETPETPDVGDVMTLAPETVPEPETDAIPMPRLDIYTDDGHGVTSKDHYKHGTATLSRCHEKFAFENVGVNIRARGNSTFHPEKKPYRLKFDEKQEMLGLNGGRAYKSWVLMADYYDGSMLRTFGTFKFAKALMENKYYSSDCTHVEVYLNGDYRGVYLLCEQTQINRGRIDLPEMAEGDTSVEQGYLMIGVGGQTDEPELVTIRPDITVYDRNGQSRHYSGVNFTLSGGTYTAEQKQYVSTYVSAVFKVVAKAVYENEYYTLSRDGTMTPKTEFVWAVTDEEKQMETVGAVFNIESAVSMCILDEICKNLDAMAFNMYVDLSPEGDGVLTLAAPWDFDFSMANTEYATTHAYTGFYATNFSESEGVRVNLWYVMLGSISWFDDLVKAHWQENYVELKSVVSEMISVNYAYDAAFNRDFDRWGKPIERSLIHHHAEGDLARFEDHMDAGTFVTDWLTMRLWWLNKLWGDGTATDDPIAEPVPELEMTFEDEEDLALVVNPHRCTVELTGEGLLLRPDAEAYDPYFSFDYDLLEERYEAGFYPILEFTYKIPTGASRDTFHTELFLCTGSIEGAQGGYSTAVETKADGEWHTVRLDLTASGFWSGDIHEIRMDFFSSCEPEDAMYLKDFRLMPE